MPQAQPKQTNKQQKKNLSLGFLSGLPELGVHLLPNPPAPPPPPPPPPRRRLQGRHWGCLATANLTLSLSCNRRQALAWPPDPRGSLVASAHTDGGLDRPPPEVLLQPGDTASLRVFMEYMNPDDLGLLLLITDRNKQGGGATLNLHHPGQ